ncbi:Tex family protein [Moheibacter lacus]|uniref:RNA-binding transcriptional accessory protein n=1 Tax=Moheibacter lacus TaxID=2745851 RepID=A0A838ZQW8_9FLAO|nr:Tex family protein [Moheibacter lacus]MBA5628343.1 RNA-binding transcriptional accessory protein [Moheibacter lacus]
MTIIQFIQNQIQVATKQIENTIQLLNEDCTIPFISRYRKEMTGDLDEVQISMIAKLKVNFEALEKRKTSILKSIEEQNALTSELKQKIENCYDEILLEDYYLPFKKQKKTKAAIAKEKGLEPLAKIIMKQNPIRDLDELASRYLTDEIDSIEDAIQGAKYIMAEWINENERVRNQLRRKFNYETIIESKVVKSKKEEENAQKFSQYFDFSEPLKRCAPHRLLAILRGENEGFLKVSVGIEKKLALETIENIILKTNQTDLVEIIEDAIADAFKRLLEPSLSNERLNEAKLQADKSSIQVFSNNLKQLLLAAPLGEKRILAIDPGYRSGCKIVCLDEKGDLIHNETVYPHAPQNQKNDASKKIKSLVNAYQIEAISIGNGTASRETENWIQSIPFDRNLKVFVVNEAGASIYSASKIARDEFPQFDVTVRGAVSIGRRLADPLSELVKIEPKSIGVGQYQHDVDQKLLKEELDETVMLCVNKVGVNLNTASKHLLNYVSGIGEKMAENIVNYRSENGQFDSRESLKNVPRLGEKAFQQASAFLRIPNGKNPLDNSAVHPESYKLVEKMAKDLKVSTEELIGNEGLIAQINVEKYVSDKVGLPTLKDILEELKKPGLDPRQKAVMVQFDKNLKSIEDLKIGMKVQGIINNITNFGCFVDIGIKQSGLVHISKITKAFISDVNQVVHLNQIVEVTVTDVDLERKRIQLSMVE